MKKKQSKPLYLLLFCLYLVAVPYTFVVRKAIPAVRSIFAKGNAAKHRRGALACTLAVAMVLTMLPIGAFTASAATYDHEVDLATIKSYHEDLEITENGSYHLYNTYNRINDTKSFQVIISEDVTSLDIYLDNATIDGLMQWDSIIQTPGNGCNVNIYLIGDNRLAQSGAPIIRVQKNDKLFIMGQSSSASLAVQGYDTTAIAVEEGAEFSAVSGKLDCTSYTEQNAVQNAVIGVYNNYSDYAERGCGTINIGTTVNVTNYAESGIGIGCSYRGDKTGIVNLNGGKLTVNVPYVDSIVAAEINLTNGYVRIGEHEAANSKVVAEKVDFYGTVTLSSDFEIPENTTATINSGAAVTLAAGKTITIQPGAALNVLQNSKLIVESNALVNIVEGGKLNSFNNECIVLNGGTVSDNYEQPPQLNADGVYEIRSRSQLFWFAAQVNNGETAISCVLKNDIELGAKWTESGDTATLTSGMAWTPIGSSTEFAGTFDGAGHTVKGLYINSVSSASQGFVGKMTSTAVVKNIVLTDSYIQTNESYARTGAICGNNKGGLIENVKYIGNIRGKSFLGGICGNSTGTIKNCTVTGNVNGASYLGGICGTNGSGFIENCHITGNVTGEYKSYDANFYAGGVVGYNSGGTIKDSSHKGDVNYTANCVNYSTIWVGGVSGAGGELVENSYHIGNVNCTVNNQASSSSTSFTIYVGGVQGWGASSVNNCYNVGDVNLTFNNTTSCISSVKQYVGGVCGRTGANMTNCYSSGAVKSNVNGAGSLTSNIGGVCGYVVNASNCYYNTAKYSGDACGIIIYPDIVTNILGKTATQFASGEVAMLLNQNVTDGTQAFYQNLDNYQTADDFPLLDNTHATVYKQGNYENGYRVSDTTDGYTNWYDYQPATLVTNENYASLKLTSDYVGYFAVQNAGQLYWFMEYVNFGKTETNCVLLSNVDLNPGYTFTFEEDTGLLKVAKDGETTLYLGTGIIGTADGENTQFDKTASAVTSVYLLDGDTYTVTDQKPNAREWFPIGYEYDRNNDGKTETVRYNGTFDGNNHTVSSLYFTNTEQSYVGLFGESYLQAGIRNTGLVNSYISANSSCAGIVGSGSGSITNCYNEATINAASAVAGIAYKIERGSISSCYNTGTLCSRGPYIGGISGRNLWSTITNCYNTGAMHGYSRIGGIVDSNSGTIEKCYNSGKVFLTNRLSSVMYSAGLFTKIQATE